METSRISEPLALRRILAILRRRWWIILAAAVIAAAAAFVASNTQTPEYESSADVLLSYQNLAGSLTGTTDSTATVDPERAAETQARLARVPEVARRTLDASGESGRDTSDFQESSSVSASPSSDLLTFRVTDEDPELATKLATEYAKQFIAYRLQLDTAAINRARQELQSRIDALSVGETATGSDLLANLIDKDQTLQTLQSLQTSNALLVKEGTEAAQVSPTPLRDGAIALGLGLLVGIGFAFLREALDTSVRSADEISERLGLTLLARIPEPPRRVRSANRLVMLEQPTGPGAEAFRMLRTNIEFVELDHPSRVIAVTSAINEEGKSTTAGNLAVAFARAGTRVILVDLDLRRPTIHKYFDLADRPGVTDIVLGGWRVDDALVTVELDREAPSIPDRNGGDGAGTLQVLPSGPSASDAGQLVSSPALGALLAELRERSELVILDTPPLLRVGDTMAMSMNIDALLVVARVNQVSHHMLSDAARLLRRMRASKLGVVVTGSPSDEDYGGYYGRSDSSTPTEDPSRRLLR
jgi:polysaccharide biosynthesis transport protein